MNAIYSSFCGFFSPVSVSSDTDSVKSTGFCPYFTDAQVTLSLVFCFQFVEM